MLRTFNIIYYNKIKINYSLYLITAIYLNYKHRISIFIKKHLGMLLFNYLSMYILAFTATLLYFYGPIGILLFSNLLMFIHTAIMIVKHMRYAKVHLDLKAKIMWTMKNNGKY